MNTRESLNFYLPKYICIEKNSKKYIEIKQEREKKRKRRKERKEERERQKARDCLDFATTT